jgi:hypothetical protein
LATAELTFSLRRLCAAKSRRSLRREVRRTTILALLATVAVFVFLQRHEPFVVLGVRALNGQVSTSASLIGHFRSSTFRLSTFELTKSARYLGIADDRMASPEPVC